MKKPAVRRRRPSTHGIPTYRKEHDNQKDGSKATKWCSDTAPDSKSDPSASTPTTGVFLSSQKKNLVSPPTFTRMPNGSERKAHPEATDTEIDTFQLMALVFKKPFDKIFEQESMM